jgi:hypothetical protein
MDILESTRPEQTEPRAIAKMMNEVHDTIVGQFVNASKQIPGWLAGSICLPLESTYGYSCLVRTPAQDVTDIGL